MPKDTEQLKSSFLDIPNSNLIKAIVESNVTRKEYIANQIIEFAKQKTSKPINELVIGVYRLIMKTGSDNYRSSAIFDVIKYLQIKGIKYAEYYSASQYIQNEFNSHSFFFNLLILNV